MIKKMKEIIKETPRRMDEITKKRGMIYSVIGLLVCGAISLFIKSLLYSFLLLFFSESLILKIVLGFFSFILYWAIFYRKFYEFALRKRKKKNKRGKEKIDIDVYYDINKNKYIIGEWNK